MAHDSCKHCNPESKKQGFSRRAFFDRVADGLYGAALTTLLSGDIYGAPAAPDEAEGTRAIYDLKKRRPPFRAKGQVRHSPFHERRPQPDGSVRSQADAREASWAAVLR